MYKVGFSCSVGAKMVVVAGFICVACYCGRAVADTTEVYEYVLSWGEHGSGPGQFNGANGMGSDAQGNLHVCDTHNERVQKFDSLGNFLMMFGVYGSGPGQFLWPRDVAVDEEGFIYVCDYDVYSGDTSWVQKFDSLGNFVLRWGGQNGHEPGELDHPDGIAVGDSGYVFVVDSEYRVQRFTAEGVFSLQWTHPDTAVYGGYAIGTYPGSVYTNWETVQPKLYRHDLVGNIILSFSSHGGDSGQVRLPLDLATDSAGNLYVADWLNKRISKFDSLGNFITMWGEPGSQPWQFGSVSGIAVDLQGAVYISDWGQDRVHKYRRVVVGVENEVLESVEVPERLRLTQNHPNPFSTQTVITYAIGGFVGDNWTAQTRGSRTLKVRLEIYNVLGQCVRTLVDSHLLPGEYSVAWDGRTDADLCVASGMYTYHLRVGDQAIVRRCILIR